MRVRESSGQGRPDGYRLGSAVKPFAPVINTTAMTRFGRKFMIIATCALAVSALFFLLAGKPLIKRSGYYAAAEHYIVENGLAEDSDDCNLLMGSALFGHAGLRIKTSTGIYDVMLDKRDGEWVVILCLRGGEAVRKPEANPSVPS